MQSGIGCSLVRTSVSVLLHLRPQRELASSRFYFGSGKATTAAPAG